MSVYIASCFLPRGSIETYVPETQALISADLCLPPFHQLLHGSVYARRPTVEPGPSEQRISQPSAESPTLDVGVRRKSTGVGGVFVYDAVKGAARVLAAQSFYPVVKICASLGVMMMDLVEKQRSADVEKFTATCLSMVNMLQPAEDVLAMRDAHGKTESALFDEVEEVVERLVEVMKIHRNKNSLSQVAGTPLFKQRLREAEAAVNGAFKWLKVSLVVRGRVELPLKLIIYISAQFGRISNGFVFINVVFCFVRLCVLLGLSVLFRSEHKGVVVNDPVAEFAQRCVICQNIDKHSPAYNFAVCHSSFSCTLSV